MFTEPNCWFGTQSGNRVNIDQPNVPLKDAVQVKT